MEDRIIELEIRFTHQQRTLDELSDVVLEQGRTIPRLEAELASLRQRLAAGPGEEPGNEPPPHY